MSRVLNPCNRLERQERKLLCNGNSVEDLSSFRSIPLCFAVIVSRRLDQSATGLQWYQIQAIPGAIPLDSSPYPPVRSAATATVTRSAVNRSDSGVLAPSTRWLAVLAPSATDPVPGAS